MHLEAQVLRRLSLSKFYLGLAVEQTAAGQEYNAFAAINHLQDSVETYLMAAAEHTNASVTTRTDFSGYLDAINEKLGGQKLPFRSALLRMNKVRVASKHDAICPQDTDLRTALIVVQQFFEEVTPLIFGTDFATARLTAAIKSGEIRDLCEAAERELVAANYEECLITCRKAFYIMFEANYDISRFKNEDPNSGTSLFLKAFCKAPDFTKSALYILHSVLEPCDYIVLDHERVENDIARDGIDRVMFWNVWRLTPCVYRADDGQWTIQTTPAKIAGERASASYVLDSVIAMALQRQQTRERQRFVKDSTEWTVVAKSSVTPIYSKADRASPVRRTVEEGVALSISHGTPGFDDGLYWHVCHYENGSALEGYVHHDDLRWEELAGE